MNLFKKQIIENHTENKTFNYQKDKVSLVFTLRTDVKKELKNFKDLLEKAIVDIDKELERK